MHSCKVNSLSDLFICQAENCYANTVGCKQCFAYSHVSNHQGQKIIHDYIQFAGSHLELAMKRISSIQQLLQKKIAKDLSSFKTNFDNLAMIALCQSDFLKQIFDSDANLINQFMYVRELFVGNPVVFANPPSDNFCNRLKTVTQAKVAPFKKALQQYTKQWQFVNLQVNYLIGNEADRLESFITYQQQMFNNHCEDLRKDSKKFNIYKYIQDRKKQQKQSNEVKYDAIYFSRQFQDFLIQKYRENPAEKSIFDIPEYVNNFWQYFGTSIYGNLNAQSYFDYQLESYNIYKKCVAEFQVEQSLLAFKAWKNVNRPSPQIANLNSHYFYETYILSLIDLKIKKSINEKADFATGALEFSNYLRDYTQFCKDSIVDLSTYAEYFIFRQGAENFLLHLKQSIDIVYNKKLAIDYLNQVFKNSGKPALKKYKQHLQDKQNAEKANLEKQRQSVETLKQKCQQEEGQRFYEYVFNNFVIYAKEKQRPFIYQEYSIYKNAVLQEYDEDYIKMQDERAKEAMYENEGREEQGEQKTNKNIQNNEEINEEEERILRLQQDDSDNQDELQLCLCCNGNPYNCEQEECKMMGCCVTCMLS